MTTTEQIKELHSRVSALEKCLHIEEKRKEVGRWAVRCWKFAYFILKRRLKRVLISKTRNMITAIAIYFK